LISFTTTPSYADIIKYEEIDFVIICPKDFEYDLTILAEHKEKYGIVTKIITLDEIFDGIYFQREGRDSPEQIKYFLKQAVENWDIKYVLIVGGKDEIPVRFIYIKYGTYSNNFISDLYYADIYNKNGDFCSWDSNHNNIFGEVNDDLIIDEVDLYPDIFIGRILCRNRTEVQLIINKIINYENNAYNSNWFKRLVLFGGDSQPSFLEFLLPLLCGKLGTIAFEGEYMGNKIAKLLNNFEPIKIYSSGFLNPTTTILTNDNVNTAINTGAGFVLFAGHGMPDRIWSFLPFSVSMSDRIPRPSGYTIREAKNLNNAEKLPVVLFCACSCGDFDNTTNPLAWEFMINENGGAISCIANTNPSYLIPSTLCTETVNGHLTISFFKTYSQGTDVLGDLWGSTIVKYMKDKTAWEITPVNWRYHNVSIMALEVWTLFGDPTLKIGGYPK
jgi:hypothetical protein